MQFKESLLEICLLWILLPKPKPEMSAPLLEPSRSCGGTASSLQTLGNIIVSIVGTGVLGLPFAFRVAGWFAGVFGVSVAGIVTYYCMLLIVQCREKLENEGKDEKSMEMSSYGDLGFRCLGTTGRYSTELLVFMSQCLAFVSYLVFIGQNLSSTFSAVLGLNSASYIFMLVPFEIGLSWIGSLSALAPVSVFADICNVLAMGIALKEDVQQAMGGQFSIWDRNAITPNIAGLPFAAGMALFCFEGFGMTLSLESSMKDRTKFRWLLGQAFVGITSVYVLFGLCGYMAYGDETRDIITLNLPHSWSSMAVQIGLCLGLAFTLPVMLHPINEIVEGKLKQNKLLKKLFHDDDSSMIGKLGMYASRLILVIGMAFVASFIPGFGVFASVVGTTVCALLSFVLPSSFHLTLFWSTMCFWEKSLDICILCCGLVFAVYGTCSAVIGM